MAEDLLSAIHNPPPTQTGAGRGDLYSLFHWDCRHKREDQSRSLCIQTWGEVRVSVPRTEFGHPSSIILKEAKLILKSRKERVIQCGHSGEKNNDPGNMQTQAVVRS